MNAGNRVLYLTEDAGSADAVATRLTQESEQISVETVTDTDEALDRLGRDEVDCVLADDGLVHPDGYDRLARLSASAPDVPLIVAFEGTNSVAPDEVLENGATDYVLVGSSAASYDAIARRIENATHRNGSAADGGGDGTRPDHEQGDAPRGDGFVRDVSEREERERELEYFETIVEGMGESIFVTDEHGEHRHVNTAGGNITGYTDEELVQASPEMLYDDEDIERFEDAIGDLLANPEQDVATVEATMETKFGEQVPVEVVQTLRRDEQGEFRGTFGVVRDVTERKRTEEKLWEYESLLQAVPDEITAMDPEGFITQTIPPMDMDVTNSGYTPEELEGMHVAEVMSEESVETGAELIAEMVEGDRERATFEMEVLTKDGDRLLREDHIALREDREGNTVGAVGVLRDIEERKAYERELERQNERLEQFASITSHDLRNPLNLAQGYMEMVEDGCDVEHTEKVSSALDRMERLIEDTLTWARQGSTVSERTPVALGSLAPDAWEAVGSEEGTIEVVDDVTVEGDPSRVRQVIENLLRNAVEHGGEDVHVEIGAIDGADHPEDAGFYVADDGPGIPPDQRDEVFDAGFTTASDGTGFGLAIIGEICDAHGWEITATESEAGGARFEITGVDRGT